MYELYEKLTGTLCADCVNLQIADIAPHHLKPGTVLRERYLIGNVIERRFRDRSVGRDLVLDTKVAVKEFYPAGHVNRNHAVTDELERSSTDQRREFVKAGVERFLDEAGKGSTVFGRIRNCKRAGLF